MKIVMDFKNDFRIFCQNMLVLYGIQELDTFDNEIEMLFWKTWYRIPFPITRNVQKSNNFMCPIELQEGLKKLENRIQCGESLYPFLSKRIQYPSSDPKFLDDLLSDWGIHHFHLGENICNNFSERTNYLLYAIVTLDTFYEIAIMPHGQWNNQQLLELVLENWPFLLKPYIIKNVSIARNPGMETFQKLRKAHIITPIQLRPDICLFSPGGGYSTDGTPTIVVENHDRMALRIRALEEDVNKGKIDAINKISQNGLCDKLIIKLEFSIRDIFHPNIYISKHT